MQEVIVLQHADCEGPGTIGDVLEGTGIRIRTVRGDLGEHVPQDLGAASALVVMGGPMGVYEQERFPFLSGELRLIEKTVHSGLPVLGICLGSQLMAAALGAKVYKGPQKEIGWYGVSLEPAAADDPIFKSAPTRFEGFHWHGDIFDLPAGATSLARSELTQCQAFRYEQAYGILFHMEVTQNSIEEMVKTFAGEMGEAGVSEEAILSHTYQHLPQLQSIGTEVFRHWVNLLGSAAATP